MKLSTFNSGDQVDAVSKGADIDKYGSREFGSNIFFKVPKRFLTNIPIENCAFFENQHPSFLSPLCEAKVDYPISTNHSVVSNGAGNLRWLKDVCDKIVKAASTQLSGDELALALCRVLNTNRAGDEVRCFLFL